MGLLILESSQPLDAVPHLIQGAEQSKSILNINQAAFLYERALEVLTQDDHRRENICIELGRILVARGQHTDAIKTFQEAGSSPQASLELATAYLQAGQYQQTIDATQSLVQSDVPERELAEVIASRALLMSARLDESQALINQALERAHPMASLLAYSLTEDSLLTIEEIWMQREKISNRLTNKPTDFRTQRI